MTPNTDKKIEEIEKNNKILETPLQKKIRENIEIRKEKKKLEAELDSEITRVMDELGISKKEAFDLIELSNEEVESEEKTAEGKKIMEDMGFKLPVKIFMSYWNKITPIQKQAGIGKKTEIETIAEFYIILNKGNISNTVLRDNIINMDIKDFEKISLYIGNVLNDETVKKK